jgi:thioredoxin family protein/AhpC/TSA family protein
VFDRLHFPPLDGATAWINSEPLVPADLSGRAVLVNFCTLTCINWLRQLPYVRAWSAVYRGDGLVVVGVHTPEFAFEHDIVLVHHAMQARRIDFPVAIDNDFAVWKAFHNRYWPALYFIDSDGIVRDEYFGEGRYEQSERVIQRLLGIDRELVAVEGMGVEAEAAWDQLRSSETYLGFWRGQQPTSLDDVGLLASHRNQVPAPLPLNRFGLGGDWTIEGERVVLDGAGGSVAVGFHARDAHLVLSRRARDPIPFRVLLDGQAPRHSRGVDIDEDGNGVLDQGRMYQLIRQRAAIRDRTVEITFLEAGAEAYAFTFG